MAGPLFLVVKMEVHYPEVFAEMVVYFLLMVAVVVEIHLERKTLYVLLRVVEEEGSHLRTC